MLMSVMKYKRQRNLALDLLKELHEDLESGQIAQDSARMDRERAKYEQQIKEVIAECKKE